MDQINNYEDIMKSNKELFSESTDLKKLPLNVLLHTRPWYINSNFLNQFFLVKK